MKIVPILMLTTLIASLVTPVALTADETPVENENIVRDVNVGGEAYGLYKTAIDFTEALDLAYTMKNLTYSLLQWEIENNVQVANVSLTRGDFFLGKAIELGENNTQRAIVFAIVAAIHYSHAPAFANPVLAKIIPQTLDENGTLTNATVEAVLNKADELKGLLEEAIVQVEEWNLTVPQLVYWHIERGDNLTAMAEELLETNLTESFWHAVGGYRAYIRGFAVLVKSVFAQKIRLAASDYEGLSNRLIVPRGLKLQLLIASEKLPAEIRERIRGKIEAGEIRNFKELAQYVRNEATQLREKYRAMQIDAVAKILVDYIIKLELRHPVLIREWRIQQNVTELYQYCRQLVENVSKETGSTGLQLLYLSLYKFQLELRKVIQVEMDIKSIFDSELVRVRMGQ
ncbi:hypothetical protein Tagg_0717 [Thermosphaera aggregans DSM 11486]|uniref:Uncharacterized protein n=1 Tax=Thermosphaera aggregans (strain DSM 11486 / M11TL) TaxID=633148 RepID=D5U1J0_THEAM|nr:hypothetical protein Tagg_0717 [Thermosphaera aggregans DSM 11486]